jgi:hypothetical protein
MSTIPPRVLDDRDHSLNLGPTTSTSQTSRNISRFNAPLNTSAVTTIKPQPYKRGLTPIASPLRPHCSARDRLKLWFPVESRSLRDARGNLLAITEADLERVLLAVMNLSWAEGTRESYGSGLLVFHVFCDIRGIPEVQRCPADPLTIVTFVSSCAGSYAGKTLTNYIYGIRAWHILHGQSWKVQKDELQAALDGAAFLAPQSSKKPKRQPFTSEFIIEIHKRLDLTSPLDAAVFACLTSAFYALGRLGEFTTSSIKVFDPNIHVKRSDVTLDAEDRHGFRVSKVRLPRTKTAHEGEDVYWAQQADLSDPKAALLNHFAVNDPPLDKHLFAWNHPKLGCRPLTRTAFLKRIGEVTKSFNGLNLKGHSIRIGGTLEYLLRGIPFDVVKSMGRWSSDAFTLYLRQHAIVMAPYLQDSPILEPFTRYTMPPLR